MAKAAEPHVGWSGAWKRLDQELARWAPASASFWWRDDDAATATPALDHLIGLAGDVPVTLAVIPLASDERLGARLDQPDAAAITVVQHGWAHTDHGVRKKAELGPERPAATILAELDAGRDKLTRLYGPRFSAVLVPPWNRIDPGLLPQLSGRYGGVSTAQPRARVEPAAGLTQTNIHVDLIDWSNGVIFIGETEALDQLTRHLAAKRAGGVDPREPTGILTHHLVQDEATSRFLQRLLPYLASQPAARWIATREAFALR